MGVSGNSWILKLTHKKREARNVSNSFTVIKKLTNKQLKSYLISAVIGYTSPPSRKHVGKNKDVTVLFIGGALCTSWKTPLLLTKTANVYTIRKIRHRLTLDIPWSTEGWLKMLGSGIVLMMTPKSSLLRQKT